MAGVAVLQPQDVLKQRVIYRHSYVQPVRTRRNSNSNPVPNPNPNNNNNNRRKRSPQKNGFSGSANLSTSPPAKHTHLVMGEVKILKRGEALTNTASLKENRKVSGGVAGDLGLSTTDRLGPEPDLVPKQMRIADFYAGSAFVSSPPPSSLPVPAFFKKKSESNDDATSDLRRLLRLDMS